ncbi:MAG: endonuclease/exonuclease/phosphatase family protein [Sphaerochaetaceae bacterium]|jgi:endonuclease/exonuclease/phosphatase family metal-dependent hydrolase
MRRYFLVVAMLFLLVLLGGCPLAEDGADVDELVVMTWNVQNLMDGVVDGTEYEEYLPASGWTESAYRARLKQCLSVLTDGHVPLPHVIVLQEIENERVLCDLLSMKLARLGYRWYASTAQCGSPIQIGVISRLPIVTAQVHAVPDCRPVLECEISTSSGSVVLLAVHGKSRKDGESETEARRILLSRTIRTILRERHTAEGSAVVLVAGDFNEGPDGSAASGGGSQTAIVEATHPRAVEFRLHGSLVVSGDGSDVMADPELLYCPWLDDRLHFSRSGSCWFVGGWHRYDQILCTGSLFDGTGWEFDSFDVAVVPMQCSPDGTPYGWNIGTHTGVSDHFPVWVRLIRK